MYPCGDDCGSAVYPRERAWSVLSNEGKAVSQYLSHFNLVVQEEERLVPRKFVVLTAYNEKVGSVVSRVMLGLVQVRVPKRKVKANSKPANLLHHICFTSRGSLSVIHGIQHA